MIHPQFNPMIGPSPYVLINMGARYQPCMHNMHNVQDRASGNISWPCPWATSRSGSDASCTLSQLCGFGGVPEPHAGGSLSDSPYPNQWYRFIIPIFLHAGVIHIGFNMLLQMTLGRDMERSIGSIRFTLVYFSAGIFGFVLGGNFAATGIASTGCSGSLFGILALTLLELLYTWRERQSPIKDLLFILVDVIISFVLGLFLTSIATFSLRMLQQRPVRLTAAFEVNDLVSMIAGLPIESYGAPGQDSQCHHAGVDHISSIVGEISPYEACRSDELGKDNMELRLTGADAWNKFLHRFHVRSNSVVEHSGAESKQCHSNLDVMRSMLVGGVANI